MICRYKEELTERVLVGLNDHPVKLGLIRQQIGVPVLDLLEQLGPFLQLLPQLPRGLSKLLPGLLHLGFTGSFHLLKYLRMPHLSLDQLVL